MRFKMQTSRSFVILLLVMMTSLVCHPSLANESRDLIDDRAPDEVRNRGFQPSPGKDQHNANQRRSGTARAAPSRAGPSHEGPSGARPLQVGPPQTEPREDPQPFEDLPMEDTPPPYSSLIGHEDPPPPAYDQLFPKPRHEPPRAEAGPSQRIPEGRGQAPPAQRPETRIPRPNVQRSERDPWITEERRPSRPGQFNAQSFDARRTFYVITPKIQRQRPTLLEIRLKKARKLAGIGNYKFTFKASDIVRQGGRRKTVLCSVRAYIISGRIPSEFTISALACKRRSRKNPQSWLRPEQYYPVRNRNFEEKSQLGDLEQVRNRNQNRNRFPGSDGSSGGGPFQTGSRQDLPPPYEPPPSYANAVLGQPQNSPNLAELLQPPPSYDQLFPNEPRQAAAVGPSRRIPGRGPPPQRPETPNPRPNSAPFNAQSSDARVRYMLYRIFELTTPKIQRERSTLQNMRMEQGRKIEGTPNYEFVFKATDITRPGGRRKSVRCSVRANHNPRIRDYVISGLNCERTRRNLQGWVTSNRYYPAVRGKRASPNKIHNRVAPRIQRRGSVSSNDDRHPLSYQPVIPANPPPYESLYPGSSQLENLSRSSSLSTGSRPAASNPMSQTYIHKFSAEARRIFAWVKPQLQQQHPEFSKIVIAPRVLKQESSRSMNYKFNLTATVLVKKRPFYRKNVVNRIPCTVQVHKNMANVYEMQCTCGE